MATLEEVIKLKERTEAVESCRKIMDLYQWLHPANRHEDYMKLWADRDDDILEMPWGIYYGKQGVVNCYVKDHHHGDMAQERTSGSSTSHHNDTEILEVAEDGQTARGVWFSPGHEVNPPSHERWSFCIYGVDFIKENGRWYIWRMRLYPYFQAPFHTSWVDRTQSATGMMAEWRTIDDTPTTPTFEFNGSTPSPYPDIPKPYKTYADVGYKYGKTKFAL